MCNEGITVLSLFDGISCGQLALKKAGIKVRKYYASEIDSNAIACTQRHFPNTIQIGDITKIDLSRLDKIDLLIGGSPCQGFSTMGKQLNFEDPRSKLFFEYVRIKNTLQPRWFLLENVRVQNDIRDEFTRLLGVEPVLIDSALFSAQSRKRYYWTNIHIQPIVDKNILFNKTVCQRRFNGPIFAGFVKKCFTILTVTKVRVLDDDIDLDSIRKEKYSIKLGRALSIAELENLQTLPDGYTDQCGSYSSREKLIGNAWTVDVVSHIFNGLRFDNGYIGTE